MAYEPWPVLLRNRHGSPRGELGTAQLAPSINPACSLSCVDEDLGTFCQTPVGPKNLHEPPNVSGQSPHQRGCPGKLTKVRHPSQYFVYFFAAFKTQEGAEGQECGEDRRRGKGCHSPSSSCGSLTRLTAQV